MNERSKAKTVLLVCAAGLCVSFGTYPAGAQDPANSAVTKVQDTTGTEGPPDYRPFTLGLDASTTGFGGYGSWRFADHFGLRAGGDYFSLSDVGVEAGGIHYNSTLKLISQPLTLDIYPWAKHSFHVSVGIMFNENSLKGTADQVGTIIVDGRPLPADTLGTLNMRIEQQLVNPYLTIGGNFFYFDHAEHWALGGELGVVYTGDPSVSLTSTRSGPLVDRALSQARSSLEDYANKFRWWPVAKIMVNYSF